MPFKKREPQQDNRRSGFKLGERVAVRDIPIKPDSAIIGYGVLVRMTSPQVYLEETGHTGYENWVVNMEDGRTMNRIVHPRDKAPQGLTTSENIMKSPA
jgi:hypothetical protein